MNRIEKIKNLSSLKTELIKLSQDEDFLDRIESSNPWFIKEFSKNSILNIANEYLDEDKLTQWLSKYHFKISNETVGIILAGNLPLVGFHDILCAYFTTQNIHLKLSSKDSLLTQKVLDVWMEIDCELKSRIHLVDRIINCDKIIATGSNNSYKYFEYYFKKYKHILRKNRTSMAVLTNDMSDEEIDKLIDDIFLYFGLGCRNVSKLWIEKGFELKRIFEASERYHFLFNHVKYMNNYDYQRTLLLLNKIPHLSNNFLMLREEKSLFSPISVLHYEYFDTIEDVHKDMEINQENIQCVIGHNFIPFGQAQVPGLLDYADGVDTMQFLIS